MLKELDQVVYNENLSLLTKSSQEKKSFQKIVEDKEKLFEQVQKESLRLRQNAHFWNAHQFVLYKILKKQKKIIKINRKSI